MQWFLDFIIGPNRSRAGPEIGVTAPVQAGQRSGLNRCCSYLSHITMFRVVCVIAKFVNNAGSKYLNMSWLGSFETYWRTSPFESVTPDLVNCYVETAMKVVIRFRVKSLDHRSVWNKREVAGDKNEHHVQPVGCRLAGAVVSPYREFWSIWFITRTGNTLSFLSTAGTPFNNQVPAKVTKTLSYGK